MDEGQYVFPSGIDYSINNQQPIIINIAPLAGPSNAHFHNAYPDNQLGLDVAVQNNAYLRTGQRNHIDREELPEGHAPPPPFPQHTLYYPSVPHTLDRRHVLNGTRTHEVRAHVHHHPYAGSTSSSRSWTIRRRTTPLTQPEVVFNFNQEQQQQMQVPVPVLLVEDPMIEQASSISADHVPLAQNEVWTELSASHSHITTPTTNSSRPSPPPRSNRQRPIPSTSSNNIDDAATFAQSSFPIGTPDYARKQAEMYNLLTSPWKLNNEFEPNAETLLRFSTKEDGFWKCAFYDNGRRCERSMTDRSRQIVEHIRRHIKLEPYVCEGQSCPTSVNGCGKRYSSGDPLRKHRDGNLRGESVCELCGKTLLPGNIIRHRNTSCRETGH